MHDSDGRNLKMCSSLYMPLIIMHGSDGSNPGLFLLVGTGWYGYQVCVSDTGIETEVSRTVSEQLKWMQELARMRNNTLFTPFCATLKQEAQ